MIDLVAKQSERAGAATETVGLVQQFVERTGQLYSLPAVAAEILRLTSEPRIDPAELKQCLARDPALATRILRVVNSSLFGASRQVTDLGQALTLLGIRPLKMLVLGFSLPKELFSGLEAGVLAAYWRQTLIKAVAARELSEHLWHIPGDEPFIAGLVQDIGQLALIQQLGPSYLEFLEQVRVQGGSLLARELETLGFDHLVLSARLLSHWGLPPGLAAAISVPPDESRVAELRREEQALPQMLHLAHLLARFIEQPYGSALTELLAIGGRYCGLTYESLRPIVAAVQQKVGELAEVLSLQLPAEQSYVDLLLAARQRLVEESLAAVAESLDFRSDERSASEELLAVSSRLQRELACACVSSAPAPRAQPARQSTTRPNRTGGGLPSRAGAAIQRCRQNRAPLSLVLFEIDRFSDLLLPLGPAKTADLVYRLQAALAAWCVNRAEAIVVSDSRLAMLWEACPRSDGVRQARAILSAVKPWSRGEFPLASELTLSGGLATLECASKNYPPSELIDAAERCLVGAQLSGGDTVKSIAF
jgi:HD-like signal output (HDOD) protein